MDVCFVHGLPPATATGGAITQSAFVDCLRRQHVVSFSYALAPPPAAATTAATAPAPRKR